MDTLEALQTFGITLPGPAYVFGAVLLGLVGLAAFRWGRKTGRPRSKWLGVALMLYPYAISQTWLLYAVGAALCIGIWIDKG